MEEALRAYDTAYIEGNLQIVERYLQAGKIRTTLAATTLDALKKDYRPRPAPREAALAATKTSRKRERTAAVQQAAAEEEEIATAARELITALANLNAEAKQALEFMGDRKWPSPLRRRHFLSAPAIEKITAARQLGRPLD